MPQSQAAVQLRDSVDAAAAKYSKQEYPNMHQKIHYLITLFDMMVQEQHRLLLECVDADDFFEKMVNAERNLQDTRRRSGMPTKP